VALDGQGQGVDEKPVVVEGIATVSVTGRAPSIVPVEVMWTERSGRRPA
jgi:hypothetical protein